ncbi:MAG: HAMP domain-containing histidine kinase [Candidatus Diapherotrites archaeon]|nr:HAMP domain-containing histidine kinase [Candidatus Diapherotrites archaeon]
MVLLEVQATGLVLTFVVVFSLILALIVVNLWQRRVEDEARAHERVLRKALQRLRKKEAEDSAHAKELEKTKEALLHAMDDLTDSYERLKDLDEMKSDFVTNVSHELRTPLTTLGLGFDLLEKEKNPAKKKEILEMLYRNIRRLQATVDAILDFSVIEAGKAVVENKRVDLRALILEIADGERPKAKVKGIALKAEVPKGFYVRGDKRWLTRAITNLVGNAVKFTDKGYVRISAKKQKDYILVSIKDTGRGIRKKDLSKIFDKFIKLETHVPGSGVGLWASKKVIEEHGGKIWIESQRGKGTTAFFTLPAVRKKK